MRLARGNAACARPIGHSRCPLSTTPPPPPLPFLAEPNELHRHLTDRQTSLQASTPSPSLAPHQSPNQAFSGLPSSLHRPSIEPPSQAFIGLPSTKPSLHRPSIESPNQAFSGLPSSLQRPSIEQPSQAFIGTPSSHCRHPNASSVLIPLHVSVNT